MSEDAAARASAEARLTGARLAVALDAAQLGLWDWDLTTDALDWDARSRAMFGLTDADLTGTVADINRGIDPRDQAAVAAALQAALDAAGVLEVEFRVLWPDGTTRWIHARGQVLLGTDGRPVRMVGTNADVTEAHRALHQAASDAAAMAALVTVAQRLGDAETEREVLEVVTAQAMDLLGAQGAGFALLVPGTDQVRTVATSFLGEELTAELAVLPRDFELPIVDSAVTGAAYFLPDRGATLAVFPGAGPLFVAANTEATATAPLRDRGHVFGALSIALAGPHQWRAAERELFVALTALTAQALVRLTALKAEQAAAQVARVAAAQQAALVAVAQELAAADSEDVVLRVVAGHGARLLGALGAEVVPARHGRDQVPAAAPGTAVPLAARGRLLGYLAVTPSDERGEGRRVERELVDAFAALTAQALDRIAARDAERAAGAAARRFSETLQRSLLTSPPEPDHLQIAVRYAPAAAEAQVGGDWYDAFLTADGTTNLVIGDVSGHDRHAAAAMGQMRNLLRGISYILGKPPGEILTALDHAVHDLGVDAIASIVIAQVEQPREHTRAGTRLLRWSNAGHPPPLLIGPGGTTRYLDTDSDLLVGLDPDTTRCDHTVVLEPGASVLLFTDGLVERRGAHLQEGLDWLAGAAVELGHLPLEELCDALLEQVGDRVEDDVALLALRAHPQDAPRPPEAGPARDVRQTPTLSSSGPGAVSACG